MEYADTVRMRAYEKDGYCARYSPCNAPVKRSRQSLTYYTILLSFIRKQCDRKTDIETMYRHLRCCRNSESIGLPQERPAVARKEAGEHDD